MAIGWDNKIKILSQVNDGSWELEDTIHAGRPSHAISIITAKLSPDGRHLMILYENFVLKIYGQGAAGSWVEKNSALNTVPPPLPNSVPIAATWQPPAGMAK
ncbi:hypothetical protein [Endozoicomonas sp. ALC066]|uniref:hypothetical protein n=1 Tax=Endozoicomonas sp. ALC066 TaxID=3403078 RepID=UPI003BB7B897